MLTLARRDTQLKQKLFKKDLLHQKISQKDESHFNTTVSYWEIWVLNICWDKHKDDL